MTEERIISYAQAILEGTDQCLQDDSSVFLMGLGVPDPGGIFGTTVGLQEKYGEDRVMDMPIAENGMTGIALGAAISGMRPIMTHQRLDFMLLAMDQIVNHAAKWHYMFDEKIKAPLVIRIIIGRGWGQGPQHSQNLASWFAHIPGLKVVAPFTPYDAKGMLISAVRDDNPVVILEHRWNYNIKSHVPEEMYAVPLDKARVVRKGADVTVVSLSHMTYEALQAAETLREMGISAEVVDVRSLRPLDTDTILESVRKTGRLIVADPAWKRCGMAGEIIAVVAEQRLSSLKDAPVRLTYADHPLPTAPSLAEDYFPGARHIVYEACKMLGMEVDASMLKYSGKVPHDVPDMSFSGPF
ncbi:alpha-ketoacid dehydrogenase subunit beta [Pseudodesulfovibrio karagichevae]|uniref:Alpha-ketoacid dehydrogenase subunit beta n=1 Tax=Pseudodesulfovibrio karagichevae TaxID=3239305 RepID=A0ABV4K1Q3_9BACT